MGHHIPALLPQIMLPMPRLERQQWRPRAAGPGERGLEDLKAAAEEAAAEAAQSEREAEARRERRHAAHLQAQPIGPSTGAHADDTLRATPAGKTHVLDMLL